MHFYNGRGTAEQWIKEGEYALNWTRLSCHRFVANQVRLQLFILAYNLGNFLRRLRCLDIERSRAGPEWCTKIRSVTQNSASREASWKLAEAQAKGQGCRPTKSNAPLIIRYHSRRVSRRLRLCLPKAVKHWSLRSVQIKLIKIGGG